MSKMTPMFAGVPASRSEIESQIEYLINLLDQWDGDWDLEDGDVDRCAAHDDDLGSLAGFHTDWAAGDPDDAEESEPGEIAAWQWEAKVFAKGLTQCRLSG